MRFRLLIRCLKTQVAKVRACIPRLIFYFFFANAKEFGWSDCEVEGVVPLDLAGTLYHNGPGRCERGGVLYKHFLDGDGFVNAWRFENGHVQYRGKFVRTPEYEAEEQAGKILFRGAFGTSKPGGPLANAFDLRSKNLANTNVVAWGGQLLALYEAAHPCRLHMDTLEFLDTDNLFGLLRPGLSASSGLEFVDNLLGMGGDAFTAHPKMDPLQRLLVGFNWTSRDGGIELTMHEWDEHFNLICKTASKTILPDCDSAPHDFGLSETRCVVLENRFRLSDLSGYLLGLKGPAESLVSQPALPQRIHILPRHGDSREPKVIEASKAVFDVHIAHCHDGLPLGWQSSSDQDRREQDFVTIYTSSWDEFPEGSLFGEWNDEDNTWPFELPSNVPSADMNKTPRARLVRHVVDTDKYEVIDRRVVAGCEDLAMEHPTIHCSYTGNKSCRYIYMVIGNESGVSSPPCGWARVDLRTGVTQRWYEGNRAFADEPHFVPRGGPRGTWTPGAPELVEDDGWLLAMLFDAKRKQSCLCILDAAHVDAGPVCRVWLPHGVPHSLHGCFVPKA